MNLGKFSISLAVKDIRASREFYQKLGFEIYDDHEKNNWMILRNGETFIGLFQGMFDKNSLTFNPTDARAIQKELKNNGLTLLNEADESTDGPTFLTLADPDGNPILIDQHDTNYKPTSA
ncbi:MAG: VOC family protein [Blastocatellia bacterium]|nr:VOC family protein [Blastocatellia bacterium]